ncbi:MAG TPA: hypothetical protein VIK86_00115 [Candidatus Paceibacterota bacterium]
MNNISSTPVIIAGLIFLIIIFAFRQAQPVSKYKGLLTNCCYVLVGIMVIFTIKTLFM